MMIVIPNSPTALFSLAGLTMGLLLLLAVPKIRPQGDTVPPADLARSVGGN